MVIVTKVNPMACSLFGSICLKKHIFAATLKKVGLDICKILIYNLLNKTIQ